MFCIDACESGPCQNGGTCITAFVPGNPSTVRVSCFCTPEYEGRYCELPGKCMETLASCNFNVVVCKHDT